MAKGKSRSIIPIRITGIRRSGKSVILEQIMQEVSEKSDNIIYDGDVALNSIRCPDNRYDLTQNLENIVYNELLYMGYEVYVYNNAGKEIDFLASKGGKTYFVQVAYSVMEEKAYAREFAAFKGIDNLSRKIIITNDEIDYSTSTVDHIKLKDFLLMESLDK